MKIVDTFLASEFFESELIYLKVLHESPMVDLFIGIESEYTFRGQYKGAFLQKLIDEDDRFAPYRHKIKVITIKENRCRAQHEDEYCRVSDTQRGFAESFLFANFSDNDFVIISDVDEFFDGTNYARGNKLYDLMRMNRPLDVERIRYWYDFDNQGTFPPMEISLPFVPLWCIKQGYVRWNDRKFKGFHVPHNNKDYLVFEYSACFPVDAIVRKHMTFAHDNFSEAGIKRALACNHWPMRDNQTIDKGNLHQWFKTVPLNQYNSTSYILDNYHRLKTHSVPLNYLENRKLIYGI